MMADYDQVYQVGGKICGTTSQVYKAHVEQMHLVKRHIHALLINAEEVDGTLRIPMNQDVEVALGILGAWVFDIPSEEEVEANNES